MERRDNEPSRQSSLPSSLIPHLYDRPQQTSDVPISSAEATTAFSGSERQEEEPGQIRLPSMSSSLALPPVSSSFGAPSTREMLLHEPSYLYQGMRSSASVSRSELPRSPREADRPLIRSFSSLPIPPIPPQRYGNPIYSDPIFHVPRQSRPVHDATHRGPYSAQEPFPRSRTWREGEAGPSSLVHPSYREEMISRRGPLGHPMHHTSHFNYPYRSSGEEESYLSRESDREYREGGYEYSRSSASPGWHARPSQSLPPEVEGFPAYGSTGFAQPPLAGPSRSWSGGILGMRTDVPRLYSPSSLSEMSSEARFEGGTSDDEGRGQKGKKPMAKSEEEAEPTKRRTTRKTAVACNFCRGRKLRCNGERPSCYNCTVRKFQCEYVPVQRRRGPGKAPKGSKSKKAVSNPSRSEPSTSTPASFRPPVVTEETTPLERPQLGSVTSTEPAFGVVPPSSSRTRRSSRQTRTPGSGSEAEEPHQR